NNWSVAQISVTSPRCLISYFPHAKPSRLVLSPVAVSSIFSIIGGGIIGIGGIPPPGGIFGIEGICGMAGKPGGAEEASLDAAFSRTKLRLFGKSSVISPDGQSRRSTGFGRSRAATSTRRQLVPAV